MKRLLIIAVMMLFFAESWAQVVLPNNIIINNATPMQRGDTLYFDMFINASKLDLSSRHEAVLTPVLRSVDGVKKLAPVVIQGRNKYKSNKRYEKLNHRKAFENAYAMVRIKDENINNISYQYSLPYENWMEAAVVDIEIDKIGGANHYKGDKIINIVSDSIITEVASLKKPTDRLFVSYVAPKAEAVKNRDRSGSAFLDFQVGKSNISADYKDNLNELTKIQQAVSLISNNKNATITSIDMRGYASPEGNYKTNDRLSASRSMALKNYLQSKYGYPARLFNVTSVAEDWDGLRYWVEKSNLDQKSNILNIINDNTLNPDAKEAKLKKLPGGTYKNLLNNYYPMLRRVEYTVRYTIRAFSVEEGKSMIKTNPGDLSLNEMFLVANTYTENSPEFKEIFDIAVKMYPEDLTANLNAGANALERGDMVSAHTYLDKLVEFADAWNNIGILAYKEGKFDQAKTLFLKAKNQGSTFAVKNLEIMKQREDYEAMIEHSKEVSKKRAMLKQ